MKHLASQMVYYVRHWRWFQNQSNKLQFRAHYPGNLLATPENQRSKWTTKNRIFEVKIQGLLHGTRFGLDHQQKPAEHEMLLHRSPSFNNGSKRACQDHKHVVDEWIPIQTG